MTNRDAVIVGGSRTPFCEWSGGKRGDGSPGGRLASISAEDLGSLAIKGAVAKTQTNPEEIEQVIMGHALQTSNQAIFGARHAGLKAGIPQEVPMLTLNRLCGSGAQSIVSAAQLIMLEESSVIVAGGMENLSQAPHVLRGMRNKYKLGRPPSQGDELSKDMEDYLFTNLKDGICDSFMAQTSDELCKRKGISRDEADEYAAKSHQRTENSIDSGIWKEEIIDVITDSGIITFTEEDHVVRGTSVESLSQLRTHFGPQSLVTAGNASGVVDGAAAVIVKSKSKAENLKKKLQNYGTKIYLVKGDLSKEKDIIKIIKFSKSKMKFFDCLINNASLFENDKLENFTSKSWENHISTNLKAPAFLNFLSRMAASRIGQKN